MPVFAYKSEYLVCSITDEELRQYEAEGTLKARLVFQEYSGDDFVDPSLIKQVMARQDIAMIDVSSNWRGGLPTTGEALIPPLD